MDKGKRELVKYIHCLSNLGVYLSDPKDVGIFVQKVAQSSLDTEIKEK